MKRNSAVILSIALCVGATNVVFAQSSGMGGMDMKSMEPKDKAMKASAAATSHSGVITSIQ